MHSLIVCLSLFLMISLLVGGYHLFVWDSSWSAVTGFRAWVSSFECGFLPLRVVENYFSYTYFVLLVFFVVFDLEVSLLLNMPYQGLLFKNFAYYIFFLVLLSVGFAVEMNKGYVEWAY